MGLTMQTGTLSEQRAHPSTAWAKCIARSPSPKSLYEGKRREWAPPFWGCLSSFSVKPFAADPTVLRAVTSVRTFSARPRFEPAPARPLPGLSVAFTWVPSSCRLEHVLELRAPRASPYPQHCSPESCASAQSPRPQSLGTPGTDPEQPAARAGQLPEAFPPDAWQEESMAAREGPPTAQASHAFLGAGSGPGTLFCISGFLSQRKRAPGCNLAHAGRPVSVSAS